MLRSLIMLSASMMLATVAASAQTAPAADYVWARACKDCHAAQYAAWERTKHATAIGRLSAAERTAECVRCHITGPPPLAENASNANVQCEQCHGAGGAHVQAAAAGASKPAAIVAKPGEATCVTCHSATSPHFKFFSYAALAPLVHQHAK